MKARFVVAAIAFVGSAAFAADAPKPQTPAASPHKSAQVVLASADDVRTPPVDHDAAPPPKPRGRVSTCRCGGQEAEQDDE